MSLVMSKLVRTEANHAVVNVKSDHHRLVRTSIWSVSKAMPSSAVANFYAPKLGPHFGERVLEDWNVWDQCPILNSDLSIASVNGFQLWIFLSAPREITGDERHTQNRFRLVALKDNRWIDLGFLLPNGFCRGSREWAGTAYLNNSHLSLYYTAAGVSGEQDSSTIQRIFYASALLDLSTETPKFIAWRDHGEIVKPDGKRYAHTSGSARIEWGIKAFRDPFYFNDVRSDRQYMVFSATNPASVSSRDACIGLASKSSEDEQWKLQEPLVDASGITHEIERPQLLFHDDMYYVFWSMHGWTSEESLCLPTGLYGMVAESIGGPYKALNGHGLVIANPETSPFQAYSWYVCNDLTVTSFVDLPNASLVTHFDPVNRTASEHKKPAGHFVGTLADSLKIELDGARSRLVSGIESQDVKGVRP